MTGPLTDLRVIEYCDEAGAWAGKLFADMGADVVKVEPPGGSRVRGYPPFLGDEPHPDRSLAFWHNNTSKRAITLDLEQEAGREVFRRLAAGAAIVLEDQSPGQMAELGLDYPDLSALNPALIMVSITPYGRSGPKSDWVATDLTVLAGGPEWSNGYDDHSLPPVRGLGNQGYQTACHWAVATALVAVLHRDWTGEGQHVGIVKATGPEGGRIQMAVYESAAEAKQAIVIFSSSDPKKLFRAVGPVLVVFDQQPAAGDRELAASCAGG